jgi:hypothetical protein
MGSSDCPSCSETLAELELPNRKPQLMKIADPNRKRPPSTRRKSHLRAINARLRAYWQDLNAIAPQRDYDNLLAQAFSGHERYRPDTVNDDHVDEAYSKKS